MSENKYELPESFQEEYQPYYCPFFNNWLVMSDLHIPYHNIPAISELIDYGIGKGIKAILINGDFLDFYQLSKFNPDPRRRSFKDELESGKDFLDKLAKWTGAKIYFKYGNHEERLERYLIIKAPELLDCEEFELNMLLGFGERHIEYIKDKRKVYIGKLPVLHGHEARISYVSVNPARSLFLKVHHTSMMGHLHITSNHNEKDLEDKIISTWSTGHLGDPHPLYAPINKWNHGAARVEVNPDGDFEVINLRLIGNKVHRT